MRILVTGATGFVGVNTVKRLSEKHEVYVFVRNLDAAKEYFGNSVHTMQGDVTDNESLENAFKYVKYDAVLHIAGVINAHNLKKLYNVNKLGSKNVAEVSAKYKIKNFIYVSSLSARGPDGFNRPVSHYGNSKRLGELEILSTYCFENVKILRPPIIFGPYDNGTLPLFKLSKYGIAPVIDRTYSFLFIDDLVEILKRLVEFKTKSPKVFYASSFTIHFNDLAGCLLKTSGKGMIKATPPMGLIKIAAKFSSKRSPFTEDKVREILPKAWTCDNDTIKTYLDFEPQWDMCSSVEKSFEWYEENGWI